MWKKVLAAVIVLLIVFGGVLSAAADSISVTMDPNNAPNDKNVKVSREEAINIALELLKKHFGIEIDGKKYQSSTQLGPFYEPENADTWQMNWTYNSDEKYIHINAEIDSSTGKLVSYSKDESVKSREQVTVASITMEQARKLAEDFIRKINPEEYKQIKLDDDYMEAVNYGMTGPDYIFNFVREANGLKYTGNYIIVRINGDDSSISSYQLKWDYNAVFPSAEAIIDKESSLELFKKKIEMELSYIPVRNKAERYIAPAAVRLSYTPNMLYGSFLDAQSGEFIDYNGKKYEQVKVKDISDEQKSKLASSNSQIAEAPAEMGSEAAEAIIKGLAEEFFGAGYRIVNINYSENGALSPEENRKSWNAEVMEDKPDAFEIKGNISIDSSTGELLNIGRFLNEDWYGREYERKLTWEQSYDKAVEVLLKYFPYRIRDIKTEQVCQEGMMQVNGKLVPDRMVYFNFPRLVNGIQYYNDSISITVDTKTGEISNIYYRWSKNLSFPDAKGVIDKEKAEDIFFNGYEVYPAYQKFIKAAGDNEHAADYRIVYMLKVRKGNAGGIIDAFTGKLLDNYGNEIKSQQNGFSDIIKGHPAEKELSILAFHGVIDTAGFEPNREITYMELVKMLVKAKGYRPYMTGNTEELLFKNISKESENYSYLLEAVSYGILENKPVELKLDAKVTREQMAELVVRLLKYEKLAKARDIFTLDFKDSVEVSSELKGHVAIAKGLGLMEGASDMFRPKENLKMHEAALIIYKMLDIMKEIK